MQRKIMEHSITVSFTIDKAHSETLREYWNKKGIGFTTGIRLIVLDWMKKEGLLQENSVG